MSLVIILIILLVALIIIQTCIKIHVLDEDYEYVGDYSAIKIKDKVLLLRSLRLYEYIEKDDRIYIITNDYKSDNIWYLVLVLAFIMITSMALAHDSHKGVDYFRVDDSIPQLVDSLTNEVSEYILMVAPESELNARILVKKCLEYNIDPAFVLAQAHLESHFGTQGLAKRTNSVWNVYAFDGMSYNEVHNRGRYNTPNESIDPYMKLLVNKYLGDSTTDDLMLSFTNKDGNRYASDLNYENRLRAIHNEIISNTNISKLYKSIIKGDCI